MYIEYWSNGYSIKPKNKVIFNRFDVVSEFGKRAERDQKSI